jgi:hypothetical protein
MLGSVAPPAHPEEELFRRHGRHIRDLRVVVREGGVVIAGVADSYYRKQLVHRDVAALWGGSPPLVRITVRRVRGDVDEYAGRGGGDNPPA